MKVDVDLQGNRISEDRVVLCGFLGYRYHCAVVECVTGVVVVGECLHGDVLYFSAAHTRDLPSV